MFLFILLKQLHVLLRSYVQMLYWVPQWRQVKTATLSALFNNICTYIWSGLTFMISVHLWGVNHFVHCHILYISWFNNHKVCITPLHTHTHMWQWKTDHLGANLNFELCIWTECALLPLYNALYCASAAGSVSEIYLRKVWNYEKCLVEKIPFKHLLWGAVCTNIQLKVDVS